MVPQEKTFQRLSVYMSISFFPAARLPRVAQALRDPRTPSPRSRMMTCLCTEPQRRMVWNAGPCALAGSSRVWQTRVSVLPESRQQGEATKSPPRLPMETRHSRARLSRRPGRSAFREQHLSDASENITAGKLKSSSFWSSACHPVWEPAPEPAPRPGADGPGAGGGPALASPSSVLQALPSPHRGGSPVGGPRDTSAGSLGCAPHGHGLVPLNLTAVICNVGHSP